MGDGYEDRAERRSWFDRLHLTWPMLLLIGWVLYELTTQPTLGAVAVCLKFGWEDFRAAIWLRQSDPRRLRGRACFWLYLAWGLTKTAGVAGLMSFAFVAISPKGPAAQGPRWAAIMEMAAWTGLTTLAGLVCATLSFCYSAVLARWGGFKLWLSRDIHRARRRDDWPPLGATIVGENHLNYLLLGALLVICLPSVLILIVTAAIFARFGDLISTVLFTAGFPLLMGGVPLLVLFCKDRVSRWLTASHPSECWGMDVVSSSDDAIMAGMIENPLE